MEGFFKWSGGTQEQDLSSLINEAETADLGADDNTSKNGSESAGSESGSTGGFQDIDLEHGSDSGSEKAGEKSKTDGQEEVKEGQSGVHQMLLSWGLAPSNSPPKTDDNVAPDPDEEPSKRGDSSKSAWGSSVGVHSLLSSWGSPPTTPATSPAVRSRGGVQKIFRASGRQESGNSGEQTEDSDESAVHTPNESPQCSPASSWRALDKIIMWGSSPNDILPPTVGGEPPAISAVVDTCAVAPTSLSACPSCLTEFTFMKRQVSGLLFTSSAFPFTHIFQFFSALLSALWYELLLQLHL